MYNYALPPRAETRAHACYVGDLPCHLGHP
jgi:hypothetical protein